MRMTSLACSLAAFTIVALCSCKKSDLACDEAIEAAAKHGREARPEEPPASIPWRADSERLLAALAKRASAACVADKWSQEALRCFVESKTELALEKCATQFTDVQKANLKDAGYHARLDLNDRIRTLVAPYNEAARDFIDEVQRELEITTDEIVKAGLRSNPRTTAVQEAYARARRRAIDDAPEPPEELLSHALSDARRITLRNRAEMMFPAMSLMREP